MIAPGAAFFSKEFLGAGYSYGEGRLVCERR